MKYFLNTKFFEGSQKKFMKKAVHTIDLISIGIVCEDGREYYAISKDFNLKEAWNRYDLKINKKFHIGPKCGKVYWIRENILGSIYNQLANFHINCLNILDNSYPNFGKVHYDGRMLEFNLSTLKFLIKEYGKSNKQISKEIKEFCKPIEGEIKFVEQSNPYNMSTKNIQKPIGNRTAPQFYGYYSSYDWVILCCLFGKINNLPKEFPKYCIDLKQTLDEKESRLMFRSDKCGITNIKELHGYPKQISRDNALIDAKWNFELYKFLNIL